MARRSPVVMIPMLLSALGCQEAEPFEVQLRISIPEEHQDPDDDRKIRLDEARYDAAPPFAAVQLKNIGGSTMFITPATPEGQGADLLTLAVAPFTEVLPGQSVLVELAMDPRTWRWETGAYEDVKMKLEGSYFFSGQRIDQPENPSTTAPPDRQAVVYEVGVGFTVDCDLDDDGFDSVACAGDDCDDRNDDIYPGAPETCDGRDQDCDGAQDEYADDRASFWLDVDGDGFGDTEEEVLACERPSGYVPNDGDCDDSLITVFPGARETCDGQDNDCDGFVDEDC